jgi:hypothetical protein
MWLQHLFSFIGTTARIFFDAIGSTLLGRLLDIVFAMSVIVAALYKTRRDQGLVAMLGHWRQEYRAGIKFAFWSAVLIYVPVVLWSVGSAVYADHTGLVERSHSLRGTVRQDAQDLQNTKIGFGKQLSDTKIECAGFKGENGSLSRQNRDQQGTINNCQTEAIKLLTPTEQKTTALSLIYFFDRDNSKEIKTSRFLLLTNKLVSPVKINIWCDNVYLEGVSLVPIGVGGLISSGSNRLAPNSFETGVVSPSWSPTSPYMAIVNYKGAEDTVCNFQVR